MHPDRQHSLSSHTHRDACKQHSPLHLLQMESASFDVVLDKGGLDALMGEDSEEGSQTGGAFLEEAARVLRPGGCYICITLAQPHVLSES